MCGICGFIGTPKDPKVSFDLINSILIKTESRGEHATGFWAAGSGADKPIIYHKEPVKSSIFVNRPLWRNVEKLAPNLLIAHCRWTSPGVGHEKYNKNNHPHVSKDFRVAMVHNGRIPEYTYLKKQYAEEISSDCDSEILLRILEGSESYHDQEEYLRSLFPKVLDRIKTPALYRIHGLREIFAKVNVGAMSVAIGERGEGTDRSLWLFRNEHRPLTLIDLQESLGQIFFTSTPEIFRAAIDDAHLAKKVVYMNQEVTELPEDYIFYFNTKNFGVDWDMFQVVRKRKYGYWEYVMEKEDEEKELAKKKSSKPLVRTTCEIVSELTEKEEINYDDQLVSEVSEWFKNSAGADTQLKKNVGEGGGGIGAEPNSTNNTSSETTIKPKFLPGPGYEILEVLEDEFNEDDEENFEDSEFAAKHGFHTVDINYHKFNVEEPIKDQDMDRLADLCDEAVQLIEEIRTTGHNLVIEQSIDRESFAQLTERMEQTLTELKATKLEFHLD